jgi:CheY-like chemotaxis protein
LIVDDQEQDRYLIKGLLGGLGPFEVVEALTGEEALGRARADLPQVIVLDLGLPDITGFEVLERLKSDPATRAIPVIIHTSRSLEDQERILLSGQTVSILDKAVPSHEEALARLRGALGSAGLHWSPAGAVET